MTSRRERSSSQKNVDKPWQRVCSARSSRRRRRLLLVPLVPVARALAIEWANGALMSLRKWMNLPHMREVPDPEGKKDKAGEDGAWSKFGKEFNKKLKMGCYEDDSNRSKISKLLRFFSTKSEDKLITSRYFYEMSENLEKLLIQVRVGIDTVIFA